MCMVTLLADVTCELDGWKKEVSVAVVLGLPVDFLISCGDHLSFVGVNPSLAVMTRSQKQKQMSRSTSNEVVMVLPKIGRETVQHQLEGL